MSDRDLQEVVNEENKMHGETLEPSNDSMSADDKREQLRRRIAAAEERNSDRSLSDYAKDATDSVTSFAKEHPVATVAGAIGIGLAIGAMTRPGRRAGRRAGTLATLATEAALAFGAGLIDDAGDLARSGRQSVEDMGDTMGRKARHLQRDARYERDTLADNARYSRKRLGRKMDRSSSGLRSLFD